MRFRTLAVAAVLALGTVSGCSSPTDEAHVGRPAGQAGQTDPGVQGGDSDGGGALTQQQIDDALLTVEHLSDEFEIDDEDDEDDDSPDWGCLEFDDLSSGGTDLGDSPEGEIAFAAIDEPGVPGVFQALSSASDADAAAEALDRIADVMADCTRVDSTEDDGTRWQFDITTDEDAWADGADQQVNMTASGSVGLNALDLPLDIRLTFLRLDNAVCMVGFFDMTDDAGTAPRELVAAATARLSAVLAGEEPPGAEPVFEDYPIGAGLEALIPDQSA